MFQMFYVTSVGTCYRNTNLKALAEQKCHRALSLIPPLPGEKRACAEEGLDRKDLVTNGQRDELSLNNLLLTAG